MPESYAPGDTGYDALYTKWASEGSPSGQFEQLGTYGGRRWRVHISDGATQPTFLLIAAAGPTSTGYNEDTETFKPPEWAGPQSGYEFEQVYETGLVFKQGRGGSGDLAIRMEGPPRDPTV